MNDPDAQDPPRDDLLVTLIDEKLKAFATKEEVGGMVEGQVDRLIKKTRAPFVWFLSGVGAVLAVFAIDLSSFDSFARNTFAAAFGMNKTIDDRAVEVLDKYFSNVDFLAGTYASSREIKIVDCGSIVLSLPFQADVNRHASSAFLSLAFPQSQHVFSVTPIVNSIALSKEISTPSDRLISQNRDYSFELTDVMRGVPANMRSSGFIHDYWVRIDVFPPESDVSQQSGATSRIASLTGLPSVQSPQTCPPIDDVLKARMLVQVAGDPRIGGTQP